METDGEKRLRGKVGQQDRGLKFSETLVAGQVIKSSSLHNGNEIAGVSLGMELGMGGAPRGQLGSRAAYLCRLG